MTFEFFPVYPSAALPAYPLNRVFLSLQALIMGFLIGLMPK